jgi:hypothetical protein
MPSVAARWVGGGGPGAPPPPPGLLSMGTKSKHPYILGVRRQNQMRQGEEVLEHATRGGEVGKPFGGLYHKICDRALIQQLLSWHLP